ncbi:MAG: IclR family transcriptional regulator [Halofilum sp. (in: g-proteobacteria)]|nr:IclR family transcriptional regulator [Halofilum sp. (in: g-proteobacteria)]
MARKRLTGSTGDRLLRVLAVIAESGRPVSLSELAEGLELPKATVHRLVNLLEDKGFAAKDPGDRHYVPGPSLHRLAGAVLQHRPLAGVRHSILRRMAEKVGEACNIVLLDGDEPTYIDRVDTAWPLRLQFEIGSRVPIHCTATGKLLLSLQPRRVRERILRHKPLTAMTPHTITDAVALERSLEEIREARVATDDQEFLADMVAIAVPIVPPSGPPIAALSVHAPVLRRSLEDLRGFLPDLRATAADLADVIHPDAETGRAAHGGA